VNAIRAIILKKNELNNTCKASLPLAMLGSEEKVKHLVRKLHFHMDRQRCSGSVPVVAAFVCSRHWSTKANRGNINNKEKDRNIKGVKEREKRVMT
jgi:hypothetical protein